MTLCLSSRGFSYSMALQASAAIKPIRSCIFWCEGVSMPAMRFSSVSRAISNAAQRKAIFVNLLLWTKDFFHGPSKINALINGLMWNTQLTRPFHRCLAFPVKLNKAINTPVALLGGALDPFTIIRLVITVIVDAINRTIFWGMSHIFQKVSKTILPSVTYPYASTAIILVGVVVGIETALFDAMPYAFNSSPREAMLNIASVKLCQMLNLFFSNHLSPVLPHSGI